MSSIINPGGDFSGNVEPIIVVLDDIGEVVKELNALLRGEISAAETYRNVLDKAVEAEHIDNVGLLRQIQTDHGRACQSLRNRIRELGGEAADSSGAWGVWAAAVQSTMSLFGGDKGGLKALLEGEEHGLKEYESALDDMDATTGQLLANQLIVSQESHISLLKQLIAAT